VQERLLQQQVVRLPMASSTGVEYVDPADLLQAIISSVALCSMSLSLAPQTGEVFSVYIQLVVFEGRVQLARRTGCCSWALAVLRLHFAVQCCSI
jgi:hypothetical protein